MVVHALVNEVCVCAARGVCVDKRTLQEQTALMLAVQGRHLDCVRILLEAGADPDICNKNKETPLYKGAFIHIILSVCRHSLGIIQCKSYFLFVHPCFLSSIPF